MSEATTVAMIGALAAIAAGVPSAIAAVITSRTRRENAEQHGASQVELRRLTGEVSGVRSDVREVRKDVGRVRDELEEHADRLDDLEADRKDRPA